MARKFSPAQMNYMVARAAFDVAYKAHRDHDLMMDEECVRLGIATPFGILPDGHPMWEQGQRLLDKENAASVAMYDAARQLFDWATETTLSKLGTTAQKAEIRDMVVKVKKMAFVEKPFIELVDMSLRLAA